MSELKSKQDNQMARDQAAGNADDNAKPDKPPPGKPAKPHGDKLRNALERGRSQTRH